MKKQSVYITQDGSPTLYNAEIGEHYHSTHGALQESWHVFIQAGFAHFINTVAPLLRPIRILEIGFGTGLNALLTAIQAETQSIEIQYFGIEKYPIHDETIVELKNNLPICLANAIPSFETLHAAHWDEDTTISPHFCLHKYRADILSLALPQSIDLIYMDAFSPETQPELWSQDFFASIYQAASTDAILTTYCAKGIVRRRLETVGFMVERIAGPPGKREMIRASKKKSNRLSIK